MSQQNESTLKCLYTHIIIGSNVTEELIGILVKNIENFDQKIAAHLEKTVIRISTSRKQLN